MKFALKLRSDFSLLIALVLLASSVAFAGGAVCTGPGAAELKTQIILGRVFAGETALPKKEGKKEREAGAAGFEGKAPLAESSSSAAAHVEIEPSFAVTQK